VALSRVQDLARTRELVNNSGTHDIDESVYLGRRVLVMSHAPTVIMEDVAIDLPDERTQLETRSMAGFGELRKHIYSKFQLAKQGWRPPAA
jgi:NitT/TauT family transport system ATP-binding protein